MHKSLTGIILAGGRSVRFGTNKALAEIGGKTAVEIAVDMLRPFVQELLISTNEVETAAFLGLPIVPDLHPFAGPAAGLEASLQRSTNERNLAVACDMPLISRALLQFLAEFESDHEAVIFSVAGHWQFFPGLYRKKLVDRFTEIFSESGGPVERRRYSLYTILRSALTKIVPAETFSFFRNEMFLNINTPEEYRRAAELLASSAKSGEERSSDAESPKSCSVEIMIKRQKS